MVEPQTEKKKGVLDTLPKLGRVSQLILLIAVFLVVFIVLWVVNGNQEQLQTGLRGTLINTQKILSVTETPKTKFEAELAQANAETEAAKASFPKPDQAPEILDSLLEQATLNDILVTNTSVSSSTPSGSIGPVLTFQLGLKGQIPKFQNFLLGLDTKLPTSRITAIAFTTAKVGEEYDTASISIDVLCYKGTD
jgi:hypothetical protein